MGSSVVELSAPLESPWSPDELDPTAFAPLEDSDTGGRFEPSVHPTNRSPSALERTKGERHRTVLAERAKATRAELSFFMECSSWWRSEFERAGSGPGCCAMPEFAPEFFRLGSCRGAGTESALNAAVVRGPRDSTTNPSEPVVVSMRGPSRSSAPTARNCASDSIRSRSYVFSGGCIARELPCGPGPGRPKATQKRPTR